MRTERISPAAARGFTLIELIVVIIVISLSAAVAMERFLYYEESAEKAAMEANVEAFTMGLRIRAAELSVKNQGDRIAALADENPKSWMEQTPPHFLGDYGPSPVPGNWYYAAQGRQLVYVPQRYAHLVGGVGERHELRFHVFMAPGGGALAAAVVPVTPYRWF